LIYNKFHIVVTSVNNTYLNVFEIDKFTIKKDVGFRQRSYHKLMLIKGFGDFIYSDQVMTLKGFALIFANSTQEHRWERRELLEKGFSCIFEKDFLDINSELFGNLVFNFGENIIVHLNEKQFFELERIYNKLLVEIKSEYIYKQHLLKILVLEVLHYASKFNTEKVPNNLSNRSDYLYNRFVDLLDRQFPIDDPLQSVNLRTPDHFAKHLCIHVNHLNRVVKVVTGKTTSEIIKARILQEAKILLSQTSWTISQIADSLGFSEVTHFSKFFKSFCSLTPTQFRNV